MTALLTPRAGIPIGDFYLPDGQKVDVNLNGEFRRFLEALVVRAGGISGVGTSDLAIAAFEDCGIEELKATVYQISGQAHNYPAVEIVPQVDWQTPAQSPVEAAPSVAPDVTEILLGTIMSLTRRLEALEQTIATS